MGRLVYRGANLISALVVAVALVVVIVGSAPPSVMATCDDLFVYDPHIDEIIPANLVSGLESAIPPLQPGDKVTHKLRRGRCFAREFC